MFLQANITQDMVGSVWAESPAYFKTEAEAIVNAKKKLADWFEISEEDVDGEAVYSKYPYSISINKDGELKAYTVSEVPEPAFGAAAYFTAAKKADQLRHVLYDMYVIDWKDCHAVSPETELDNMKNYLYEVVSSENAGSYEFYLQESGYHGINMAPACFEEFIENDFMDRSYIRDLLDVDSCEENEIIYKLYLEVRNVHM